MNRSTLLVSSLIASFTFLTGCPDPVEAECEADAAECVGEQIRHCRDGLWDEAEDCEDMMVCMTDDDMGPMCMEMNTDDTGDDMGDM